MKDKTKPIVVGQEPTPSYPNHIQVGEIVVSSTSSSIQELAGIVVSLALSKPIQKYLDINEKKRILLAKDYTG
jgi:hypothetical protein